MHGTTAIVTGASSGVGAATARALAALDVHLAVVARREERLQALVTELGGGAAVLPADLTSPQEARRVVEAATERLGHLDVLVCCQGTNVPRRGLAELSVADWDAVLAANLSSVFYCIHAALPSMRAAGRGLIISISSLAGLRPSALSGAAYSVAKAGLNMLSGCINEEEARNGIRSCVISPGDIESELLDRRPHPPSAEQRRRMLQPEDVAQLVVDVIRTPPRALVDQLVVRPTSSS